MDEHSGRLLIEFSQPVVAHDGFHIYPCQAQEEVEIGKYSHDDLFICYVLLSGFAVICLQETGVVDLGGSSHDHHFSQHVVSRYTLRILRCLALEIAEVGKHSHDRVILIKVEVRFRRSHSLSLLMWSI